MTVKSSHKDIPELREPSSTHCESSLPFPPFLQLNYYFLRTNIWESANITSGKKVWNPQVQVFKHLSKHLTFRWDPCYKCSSLQSASVKTQGMTRVILTFCKVSSCKHTLRQSFTTLVLAETMKFKKSSKCLSLVHVTPEFMETLGGNSSRFSCYLIKIISLCFKSPVGLWPLSFLPLGEN